MATAVQRGYRKRPKNIFPFLEDLEVFLHRVEQLAPRCGVNETDTRWLVRFLRERFGQGLRSELEEIRSRRVSAK